MAEPALSSKPSISSVLSEHIHLKGHKGHTENTAHGALPIVVGITGHRDLRPEDIPTLEKLVREILDGLRRQYPATPLIVLSPLAEGADRLGARVALECGARLVVPLPMRRELYINDFETRESLEEFDQLLARAESWFQVPLMAGVTEDDIRDYGPARDDQYGYMGAYIVRNSQLLIALWDGVPAQLMNGTGDIVTFNLHGVPERFSTPRSLLDPPENDPVFHIVTPRRSNPNPVGTPLTMRVIYPSEYENDKEGEDSLKFVFEQTNAFNRDSMEHGDRLTDEREKSKSYIIGADALEMSAPELRRTLDLYSVADSLAGYYSRHTHDTLNYLFLLVTGAAIIFDLYTHLFPHAWILLLGYLLLLVVTYFLVLRSERRSFQSKYLDYRALAEGLRVQFFWELAGIRDSVADYYLQKQRSELDWIRYATRLWDVPSSRDYETHFADYPEAYPVRLRLVLKHWVEDQLKYYRRASKREEHGMHRLEKAGARLVVLGISLALVQVVLQIIHIPALGHQPIHPLLVAIALAPILAGLMIGYAEKRAFGDHAKQYERMSILFANAHRHLARLLDEENYERAQDLIAELGREALMENGDWVLIHRDRPIEVPKG
jgi:hypothetical protein